MFSISCSVLPDLCCVNLPARFLIFLSTSCLNIAEKCWYFKGLPLDLFTSISRARVCWKVWQSCLQHLLNLHHDYHSQLLVLKDLDCYSAPFFQWFRLWLFVFFFNSSAVGSWGFFYFSFFYFWGFFYFYAIKFESFIFSLITCCFVEVLGAELLDF